MVAKPGRAGSLVHLPPIPAYAYTGPLLDLGADVAAIAASLGEDFSRLPVAAAAAEIGRLYCSLLPPKHRGANGVFYTPAPLVSRLLDDAEAAGHDWAVGKAIDPSCGGGAFMIDATARMVKIYVAAESVVQLTGAPSCHAALGRYSPGEYTGTTQALVEGRPEKAHFRTSYVERQNLTMRMLMRRFTRVTNAFSTKVDNPYYALAFYFRFYSFVR